jgi:hypothetical protein
MFSIITGFGMKIHISQAEVYFYNLSLYYYIPIKFTRPVSISLTSFSFSDVYNTNSQNEKGDEKQWYSNT